MNPIVEEKERKTLKSINQNDKGKSKIESRFEEKFDEERKAEQALRPQ